METARRMRMMSPERRRLFEAGHCTCVRCGDASVGKDLATWNPLHVGHLDADGDVDDIRVVLDGVVPEGWEVLHMDPTGQNGWIPADFDVVRDGTGALAIRRDGRVLPNTWGDAWAPRT